MIFLYFSNEQQDEVHDQEEDVEEEQEEVEEEKEDIGDEDMEGSGVCSGRRAARGGRLARSSLSNYDFTNPYFYI